MTPSALAHQPLPYIQQQRDKTIQRGTDRRKHGKIWFTTHRRQKKTTGRTPNTASTAVVLVFEWQDERMSVRPSIHPCMHVYMFVCVYVYWLLKCLIIMSVLTLWGVINWNSVQLLYYKCLKDVAEMSKFVRNKCAPKFLRISHNRHPDMYSIDWEDNKYQPWTNNFDSALNHCSSDVCIWVESLSL